MRAPSIPLTTTSIASRFLVALLDEAGRPPDALLERYGLQREALASPDFALPLEPFRELWSLAAAVRPDIGLRLLERFPPGQMHVLAHLALRSATVRAAVEDVCRFAGGASAPDRPDFAREGPQARPGYAPLARGMAAALPYVDHFVEGHSMAAMDELAAVIAMDSPRG